jgi:pimeloyl-ACP methyl ester carboxylesterase
MLHGSDHNRADPSINMLEIAGELARHGYNILMFDMRGHGESEGDHISAGFLERKDLLGAIDYAKQKGASSIGILGFSMGGATALLTAAESTDIKAVIADSTYADLEEIINYQFSQRSNLPSFFIPAILFMNRVLYGIDFTAVKPVEAIKTASCPVLIIVGGQDDTVTVEQAQRLKDASSNPESRIWIVPEARHAGAYIARPQEYINRAEGFFDIALR